MKTYIWSQHDFFLTPAFPQEKKSNFLMRPCHFPQYWVNPHSHPHPCTLWASTTNPGTFLQIHFALDLWIVVHQLPSAWSAVTYIPCLSKLYSHSRLSSDSTSHLQTISVSSRACVSFSPCLHYSIHPDISLSWIGEEMKIHAWCRWK